MVVGAQRGTTSTNLAKSNWEVSWAAILRNDLIDDVQILYRLNCHGNNYLSCIYLCAMQDFQLHVITHSYFIF